MSSAVRREWDARGVDVGVDVGVCYQAATSQARETRTRRARLSRGLHLHSPAEYVIPIWVVDYLRNIQILNELVLEYSAGIWGSEAQCTGGWPTGPGCMVAKFGNCRLISSGVGIGSSCFCFRLTSINQTTVATPPPSLVRASPSALHSVPLSLSSCATSAPIERISLNNEDQTCARGAYLQ